MRVKKNAIIAFLAILLGLLILAPLGFFISYQNKIYPNIWVGDVNLGGKTLSEAQIILKALKFQDISLATNLPDYQNYNIELSKIDFKFDPENNIEEAYLVGRDKRPLRNLLDVLDLKNNKKIFPLKFHHDENKLKQFISTFAGQIVVEPEPPTVKIVKGEALVDKGKDGADLNLENIYQDVLETIAYRKNLPINIELIPVSKSLNQTQVLDYTSRSNSLVGKSLNLVYENLSFVLQDSDLVLFLEPKGGYDQSAIDKKINSIAQEVNSEPQNPVFIFLPAQAGEDGRVKEFAPSKDGLEIKKNLLKNEILDNLSKLQTSDDKNYLVQIPVSATPPKINTSEVNNLGIVELIGKGTSKFKGSIPSRVFNVNLAASRINGSLIKPGEVFSFNNALGDISKLTGYKEAYVIKDGKTVLGDGGGVCQVSTTLFRAVLNAGLPINERRAHAYRVYYYEQDTGPGLDATVYSPTTDFKFKNDTPGHILIQAKADTKNLTLEFELYGTKDGRVSSVSKPITTQVTDPGDDIYQDDPTLPGGVVKQTEHKAWGAKVIFNYEVKRGEEIVYQKQFVSNYRPWPAVFLRGTGPT